MERIYSFFITLILLSSTLLPGRMQTAEFQLILKRDFGYGNGSDVRGNFHLDIFGDKTTIRAVSYRIDGQEIAKLSEAPFVYKFVTSDFPNGWHTLNAVVEKTDGSLVTTPDVSANFLSNEQQNNDMQKILIPLLSFIAVIFAVSIGAQIWMTRGSRSLAPGAARNYGIKGGAICPRCGRPYAIHFFSINLIGGYFDRCDYCGKWAFVRAQSRQTLQAAEQAEGEAAQAAESAPIANSAESEAERLRKMLDDSRFNDQG